ncbi:MAG: DUF5670 family protein [Acidobacteria bacterium]|nr:DUF5670 family protein [Acidobacteriota bacterium]
MLKAGLIVLVGTFGLVGVMLLLWMVGLVAGIGGGLIHLLLVLSILLVPAGLVAGVVLIIIGAVQSKRG